MSVEDDIQEHRIEEENYFVSMTDMMVGLVFIFIILLMYYALQLRQATDIFSQTTKDLTSSDKTRTEILKEVQARLLRKGLKVEIDAHSGVLRLPDEVLFDSAKSEIKPAGIVALQKLGSVLEDVLPCYTDSDDRETATMGCKRSSHRIESLFIEGHTDKDPLTGGGLLKDNYDLSVMRATNTYRQLIASQPELTGLCVKRENICLPILSVSGYGPNRPAAVGEDSASKAKNRRIDLRLLMEPPSSGEAEKNLAQKMRSGR